MKGPQTWKDIVNKKPNLPNESSLGHDWEVTGSSGGKKFVVKRVDNYKSAQITNTPKTYYFKCNNCNISGTKKYGEVIPDDPQYQELTCNDIIIKDIIL